MGAKEDPVYVFYDDTIVDGCAIVSALGEYGKDFQSIRLSEIISESGSGDATSSA